MLYYSVEAHDFDRLLDVMSVLNQMSERKTEIETIFEPLTETVEALRNYNVEFPDTISIQVVRKNDTIMMT